MSEFGSDASKGECRVLLDNIPIALEEYHMARTE
jgi:hypothetical protein